MKRSMTLLAAAFALSFFACDNGEPGNSIPSDSLELTYVSGHLGIYADCPAAQNSGKSDFAGEASSMRAPCPADDEDCFDGGFMNCESAQVTFRIRNIGTETIENVNITELKLLAVDNSVLNSLTIEAINVPVELEDGLQPGEEVLVSVEFQGPDSGWAAITHPVQVLVIDDENNGAELITPPLDSLPMMVS